MFYYSTILMRTTFSLLLCLIYLGSFAQELGPFRPQDQPPAPDYAQGKYWSALPFRHDAADEIPNTEQWVSDSLKNVDVFYIYPTIYRKGATWCADVNDEKLNQKIDRLPVRLQASVFNASCRVYAPRYRQGIIKCYYDTANGKPALDFAYEDVKRAFEYYLQHYNHGRPIIIASHSQGSTHALKLLHEYFDGKPLSKQLVCAYVVGMGIDDRSYHVIKPCGRAAETGCYVTWSSFKAGYDPQHSILVGRVGVNPISWTRDTAFVPASASLGSIFLSMRKRKHASSAQLHDNYLWVRTKLPFVRFFNVLHVMDYNLFWYDIRQNVADRVKAYGK
jgi:hypothetical protein